MHLLIGIDDTDNKESRGTGFLTRQLAWQIEEYGLGSVHGITRHQLYVHKQIAYTSQNSSACLEVKSENKNNLGSFCADFLLRNAAQGSDAGMCMAMWDGIVPELENWGKRAKKEVLDLDQAARLASRSEVYLDGFTGSRIGQIGALAAVGLRKTGNDGRFIWLRGTGELRDFDSGVFTVDSLRQNAGIEHVQTIDGALLKAHERIFCSGWTRPVLRNNKPVLLVEKSTFANYDWKTIGKDIVRTLS
jgi:hypothetical protein